ncbi:hypothetical protein IMCC12053_665 [Celeribacter marinus]|uniref:Uncharacterized protein n=1 Tax=Celeribacter marinus TaxID=1397108 RepID=A0A0N7HI97_9RHOB|nr:hypothetical protein IMCC12053_665 [Celeribacter marinus]
MVGALRVAFPDIRTMDALYGENVIITALSKTPSTFVNGVLRCLE